MIKDKLENMILAWGPSPTTGELGYGIHTGDKELVYKTPTIKIRGELYNRVYVTEPVRNYISRGQKVSYNHAILDIDVADVLTVTHVDFPNSSRCPKERRTK